MYGFRGGPAGVMKGKYVELSSEYVYPYRNQVFFSFFFRSYDLSINALLPLFLVWQEMFAQVDCSCILLQHVHIIEHVDIVFLSVNFVACLTTPVSEICI